jgi:Zn-finger protein
MSVYYCPRCGGSVANVQGVESCTNCTWVEARVNVPDRR